MKLTHHLPERSSLHQPAHAQHNSYVIKEIVYSKYFRYLSCKISLRPFCIHTDMPLVYNWAWKYHAAPELIAASYRYTSESSFACSYMALLNDRTPIGEIDICHAIQDELCDHYKALPGDFIMRLIIPGRHLSKQLQIHLIQTCTEYFFENPRIERIIAEPELASRPYDEIMMRSGFRFLQKIYQSYKISNLYYCTRDSIPKKRTI